jgi:hemolysin activation/secretion protein
MRMVSYLVPHAVGVALLVAGGSAWAQNPPGTPAAASTDQHFDVLEYRVLGNSRLGLRAVESAIYPYLGPNRDFAAVEQARASLQKAYSNAGYGTVVVDIPEQQVGDDGVVRLRVTEGRLERVRVKGARYYSGRDLLAQLPALQVGVTPNLPALQKQLANLNAQTTDRTITPILKAGPEPGTVDVDLIVRDNPPLHASVEADNQYTANTTPNRTSVAVSYDNLWQLNHSLSLQFETAPADPKQAEVESATYLLRTENAQAPLWAFSYVHTNSNVAAVSTLGVLGDGSIYGLRWVDPVLNTAATSQSVTLGADYKDFLENVELASSPGLRTPVRYINWTALYSGAWRASNRTVSFTTGINFGMRGVVNQPAEFESRRYGALPNYLYVRSSGQVLQGLPGGFAILARATGQWSPTPLIDDEQFSLGGSDTVRGYLVAETLGDDAAAGTLEIHSPVVGRGWGRQLNSFYGFVFGDAGVVGLEEPLPSQERWTHLGSTGVGLRMEGVTGFQGSLDWALPLVTGPYTRRGDSRIDFSVRYGF